MEQALRDAQGLVTYAARLVGCTAKTMYNYCERYPELQAIRNEYREELVDQAEAALLKGIREGQPACILYALNQLGRARGYGKRMIGPEDNQPVNQIGHTETFSEIILPDGQKIVI